MSSGMMDNAGQCQVTGQSNKVRQSFKRDCRMGASSDILNLVPSSRTGLIRDPWLTAYNVR